MAYNYSRWLMVERAGLIEQLRHLADSGERAETKFDTAEEARRFQFVVNETMANLARNRADLAYIRLRVRTTIDYRDERYVVRIGVPAANEKPRGFKPRPVVLMASETETTYGIHLEIAEDMNVAGQATTAAWLRATVAAKEGRADTIEFKMPPADPQDIRLMAEKMEALGMNLLRTKPTMVFSRK